MHNAKYSTNEYSLLLNKQAKKTDYSLLNSKSRKNNISRFDLDLIPEELMDEILSYLSFRHIGRLMQTSASLYKQIANEHLEKRIDVFAKPLEKIIFSVPEQMWAEVAYEISNIVSDDIERIADMLNRYTIEQTDIEDLPKPITSLNLNAEFNYLNCLRYHYRDQLNQWLLDAENKKAIGLLSHQRHALAATLGALIGILCLVFILLIKQRLELGYETFALEVATKATFPIGGAMIGGTWGYLIEAVTAERLNKIAHLIPGFEPIELASLPEKPVILAKFETRCSTGRFSLFWHTSYQKELEELEDRARAIQQQPIFKQNYAV